MKKIVALLLSALIIIPMGLVFSSAAETNIAQGKTYTYTGAYSENGTVFYPDTDNKELTDGVTGTKEDIGYGSGIWTGVNIGGANANKTDMKNDIVLDLGKVESGLVKFVVFAEDCGSGISKLKTVDVLASDDNTNFTSIGAGTEALAVSADDTANPAFGIYSYTLSLTTSISARYIKFVAGHTSNWAFLSEVQVFQNPDAPVSEPTTEKETITVDGKFDDNGWKSTGWTHVDSANGLWTTALEEGETRSESYDYQFRSDASNLYFALKYNATPYGTAACNGNGSGSNFRLWTFVEGAKYEGVAYTTYNSFINIAYIDGQTVATVRQNTAPTANTSVEVTLTGLDVKATVGTDYWYIELAVPFASLGATTGCNFYTTMGTPLSIGTDNKPVKYNSLAFGKWGPGTEADKLADTPYKNWDESADIEVKFADIALGDVEPEVEPISVFVTTFNQSVTAGAGAIFTNSFSGVVDGKVAYDAANIRWTSYLLAKPAATAGQYEITFVGENLSEGSVTIPEGGFLLAAHWNDTSTESDVFDSTKENRAAILKFKAGDIVTLKGIDLTAGTLATDASVNLYIPGEVPDYIDITGETVANPSYTLDMTVPTNYKPGDTINVVITLNNIKVTSGIELIAFKLYYDATRVDPVVVNNPETDNEEMNAFLTKAPNKDKWECFGKLEADQSRYDLSFLTGQLANVVKVDGDLVITVPFKVKSTAKGSIAFQMPHKDTEANDHDTNKYFGNAGLAVVKETPAETSSETSSITSSTVSDIITGDAGTIAVVMVAILALAGVTLVAVKKRSR